MACGYNVKSGTLTASTVNSAMSGANTAVANWLKQIKCPITCSVRKTQTSVTDPKLISVHKVKDNYVYLFEVQWKVEVWCEVAYVRIPPNWVPIAVAAGAKWRK